MPMLNKIDGPSNGGRVTSMDWKSSRYEYSCAKIFETPGIDVDWDVGTTKTQSNICGNPNRVRGGFIPMRDIEAHARCIWRSVAQG